MIDPERLLTSVEDDFERRILGTAARDRGSEAALGRTLHALGVAAGAGSAGPAAAAPAHPVATGMTGAASLGKALGFVAIGAVTGALSTGGAVWLLTPPHPVVRPATVAHSNPASPTAGSLSGSQQSGTVHDGNAEMAPADGVSLPAPAHRDLGIATRAPARNNAPALRNPSSFVDDTRREGSPTAASTTMETSALASELGALESVRAALDQGRSQSALELLDAYARRFAAGSLGPEAVVLRIEALFQSGDRAGASDLAGRFLASHPESPHAAHLRTLITEAHAK